MPINTDIQQKVFDLLSRASNLSFVSAVQEGGGLPALLPGQRITAEVVGLLPNNQAQVRVGSSQYRLELPMAVRAGQNLEMTYISGEPRTTFALARPGLPSPPVSLSDASRLLALLVDSEQMADPQMRSSLQTVGDMLRRTSGEAGVLANLMDEALTYAAPGEGRPASALPSTAVSRQAQAGLTAEQARLSLFESNASQILQNIARNSRFILIEAANTPVTPLPLLPGEEVNAAVIGTLPAGRTFVQVAGNALELKLPRPVNDGDILRLTYISPHPRPTFAVPRTPPEVGPGTLSEAGRWLGILEHSEGGLSGQQLYVLERLNTVLKSLPPDSPAFTAIQDEAITYETVMRAARPAANGHTAEAVSREQTLQGLRSGNNIVLSDDMARLLQALIKGDRLALLEAQNRPPLPAGFAPGEQVKAEVLAVLGGGRFLVQVGKQALEFNLPKGTQRGDLFTLFFISEEPTATFLVTRFGRQGDSQLSETGRWLSGFLGETALTRRAAETFGIIKALLDGPPADGAVVSRQLQQGLRESGLFYESHLARWFAGDYPLEQLMREPQSRFTHAAVKQGAVVPELPHEGQHKGGLKAVTMENLEAAINRAGRMQDAEGGLDRRGVVLVREQLENLQSGQLTFRGELFPGQRLEWTVREREARRNREGETERAWDTALRLDLPGLGRVEAKLKLDGGRIHVDIRSGQESSTTLMESERARLTGQLQSAGLEPVEIRIRHEEI